MEKRDHVSFQANRLKLVITSTKYDELYILTRRQTEFTLK
jgi:hypothetical protein